METEGQVYLRKGDAERVGTWHRGLFALPRGIRLLGGLQPEPRDDRRAERPAVALLRGVPRQRGPQRYLLLRRPILEVRQLVAPAQRRTLEPDRDVVGPPLEHLESLLPRQEPLRPRRVRFVVDVRSRVPGSARDVRDKGVERIRREGRVVVLEPVPSLRLPVDEPAAERSLHRSARADATGDTLQLRRRARAGLANLADHRIFLHVAIASLDVLRGARLEGVPVGGEHGRSAAGSGLGRRPLRERGAGRGGFHALARRASASAAGGRHKAPGGGRTAGPGRVDGLAEHGVARCGRRCLLLPGGRHPGGELGDKRVQAVPPTSPRVVLANCALAVLNLANILRVRDLRDLRHLVLLPATVRRVRGLVEPLPLPQALLEPPVRHDALQARLVRLGPFRAFELVAHEVGRLAVEHAHVLAAEKLAHVDELLPALARVPGDAHAHVGHVGVAVERRRGMVEDAVVDGHELALVDASLDPGPRDDALPILNRALAEHGLSAALGGHEDDVRRGILVVFSRDPRAESAEGLGGVLAEGKDGG